MRVADKSSSPEERVSSDGFAIIPEVVSECEIAGLKAMLDTKFADGKTLAVIAASPDGSTRAISTRVRIDTPQEIAYFEHGGILQYVLRQLATR